MFRVLNKWINPRPRPPQEQILVY